MACNSREKNALPVIDHNKRFIGLINADQLLAVLFTEHEEDLSRLSGLMKSTVDARISSEETVNADFGIAYPDN